MPILKKNLDYSQIHAPRLGGAIMSDDEFKEKDDENGPEVEKEGSDIDFVRERLADESGGVDTLTQALDKIQDPQLKEMMAAIQEDEQKHQAALEQWMTEHGGEEEAGEGETPAEGEEANIEGDADLEDEGPDEMGEIPEEDEEEEGLGKDEDSGKSDLIDDIREVLAEHDEEAEKGEEEGAGEEQVEAEKEDENLPDFLKEDDEDKEEEDDIAEKCNDVRKAFRVPIIKADKQIVYGVVSEPDSIDLQGDRLSKSEIRKACHKFMMQSQRIGKEHEGPAKADVIESYIAPTDFTCNGQVVKAGSWVMAVKIHDDDLWQDVKKGEITGFSIAGTGTRTSF
jgi:hypothetical protein